MMPAHHCWGIDYLKKHSNEVDTLLFNASGIGLPFWSKYIWFNIKLLFIANKYDVIISFANPIIGILALFKSIGIVKPKLFTTVHHYSKHMQLFRGYNKIIFLSNSIKLKCARENLELANKMYYIKWGPDMSFYSKINTDNFDTHVVISTGKVNRDIESIMAACNDLSLKRIIITDKIEADNIDSNIIASGVKSKNAISYREILNYLHMADINVIAIKKNKNDQNILCGLTSLLDAVACGQPVIISDNTNISINVQSEGFGLCYKAGDRDDLKTKLVELLKKDFVQLGNNAEKYAKNNSYVHFCEKLYSLIISN